MNPPFAQASYLAQVRRLRQLAATALTKFSIAVRAIEFIHHGENATFCIYARNGRKYLLRVHRSDYHTKPAIQEELAWLEFLSWHEFLAVPKPVRSKNGELLETVTDAQTGLTRNCCVFEWIEGRFVGKGVKPTHLFEVGQVLAELQLQVPRKAVRHRKYWSAEGLAGKTTKFGSVDALNGVSAKHQHAITRARDLVFKKLRGFESRYPERQGLIHADLHFGNILSVKGHLGAIDFDDCGYGFYAYDLVIPYLSVEGLVGPKEPLSEYREALLTGYATKRAWDRHDEEIYHYLVTARKLLMLGWLNSRSDNPRLKKLLKGAVKRALNHIQKEYEIA